MGQVRGQWRGVDDDADGLARAVEAGGGDVVSLQDVGGQERRLAVGGIDGDFLSLRVLARVQVGLQAVDAVDERRNLGRQAGRDDGGGVFLSLVLDAREFRLEDAGELGRRAVGDDHRMAGPGGRDGQALGGEPIGHLLEVPGRGQEAGRHFLARNDLASGHAAFEFIGVADAQGKLDLHRGAGLFGGQGVADGFGVGGVGRRAHRGDGAEAVGHAHAARAGGSLRPRGRDAPSQRQDGKYGRNARTRPTVEPEVRRKEHGDEDNLFADVAQTSGRADRPVTTEFYDGTRAGRISSASTPFLKFFLVRFSPYQIFTNCCAIE